MPRKTKQKSRLWRLAKATKRGFNSGKDYFRLRNFDGIKLRGGYFTPCEREDTYYTRTRAALELIKQRAPKEYASVKKHIRKIVFESDRPVGYYQRSKTFVAHFNYIFSNLSIEERKPVWEKYKGNMKELEVMRLAGTLYHETFHGIQIKTRGKKYYEDEDRGEAEASAATIQLMKKIGAPDELIKGVIERKKQKDWRRLNIWENIRQIPAQRERVNREEAFRKLRKAGEKVRGKRDAKESQEN